MNDKWIYHYYATGGKYAFDGISTHQVPLRTKDDYDALKRVIAEGHCEPEDLTILSLSLLSQPEKKASEYRYFVKNTFGIDGPRWRLSRDSVVEAQADAGCEWVKGYCAVSDLLDPDQFTEIQAP